MPENDAGWSWFETARSEVSGTEPFAPEEIPVLAARCFSGSDGARLLEFLRSLTMERVLAPDVSSDLLRYLEGQRHLVAYLSALVRRGQRLPAQHGLHFKGQHDDR